MKALKERVEKVFFGDTWLGALLWFVAAFALVAILVWFLVYSGFGDTAAPVYEHF